MYIVCLDLEGVLTPEIWIAFAEETGIAELRLTTRDVPDYDALMKHRIGILDAHNLGLMDIQNTIAKVKPMEGAREFLDELRELCQVIILSDTFTQFAQPLMKQLGMPTIFCNSLEISPEGRISGYRLRQQNGKLHAVKALKSIGFQTLAAGDSFNDLAMIREADRGFLFRAPSHILGDNPDIPAFTGYDQFLVAIKAVVCMP
jgi:phosphoserine/homoserine phosphotransferase